MTPEFDCSFTLFKARAHERSIPLTAHLELTYACTWRCAFCYNSRHKDIAPLPLRNWLAVLDDLRSLGTLFVTLTGGEPMAHPHFFEIAREVRRRHLAVTVFTNGSLIDSAAADRMADIRPLSIVLSLHGATAPTHDRTTGVPGSFDALMHAVRHLKSRALPVVLRTPMTCWNEHEMDALIALAQGFEIPLRLDPALTPCDDGSRDPLDLQMSASGIDRLMRRLSAIGSLPTSIRVPGGSNCGVGRSTLAIDPEGTVYPCIQWRHAAMGNVRTTPLTELWTESAARKEAAAVALQVNGWLVSRDEAFATTPYCPGEAVLRAGSPFAASHAFELQARATQRLRGPS
jgi:MoaA/NifB/PqqE/SkfB family radical SAM enzyme